MFYTPKETKEAEAAIAAAWDGPLYTVPVQVFVAFTTESSVVTVVPTPAVAKSQLRGDLDNYLKTVMDGLNGVAWLDDKQVHGLVGVKR